MSWDIFVMDLPRGIKSISDIPKDFVGSPIGLRCDIIAKITALYPQTDFSDPSWGTLQLPDCWIEFGIRAHGALEEVHCLCLHVRGNEHAPDIVADLLGTLGLPAIDPSSSNGLFQHDSGQRRESFARWRAFRSRVSAEL